MCGWKKRQNSRRVRVVACILQARQFTLTRFIIKEVMSCFKELRVGNFNEDARIKWIHQNGVFPYVQFLINLWLIASKLYSNSILFV